MIILDASCFLIRKFAGHFFANWQLCATPALADRLREIGSCEDRVIKLLTSHSNIICLVCNTRLAISEQLARSILVEPVAEPLAA